MRRLAAAVLALLPLAAHAQLPATPAPPPAAAPDATPAPETPPPPAWLPRGAANLVVLDKVSSRPTPLTVRVGQAATVGPLTIAVRACVVRPPDQRADAAAFLDITDAHAGEPGFHGWMLADEPSVSMLQHPIYDLRLTGCGA